MRVDIISEVGALAEKMRAIGVSNEEVVAMLGSLEKDRKTAPTIQAPEVDAIEKREIDEINNAKSQQEMNRAAGRRLERLNLQLEHALERLRLQTDGERLQKLEDAQQAWLEFREKVAEFVGEPWGRGTMRRSLLLGRWRASQNRASLT
jgi:uncharacterized protein YecT (DUF1311 family)